VRRDDTLRRWVATQERARDKRTGVTVQVWEDGESWGWRVLGHQPNSDVYGEASSRKSARAAARRYVRSLPGADSKPDRQLPLFK
jgi:hypothetical protein